MGTINLGQYGIYTPADVAAFIRMARADYQGTAYPQALEVARDLASVLTNEGFSAREIRTFAARFVMALEGYDDESQENSFQILNVLADVDFKQYWS